MSRSASAVLPLLVLLSLGGCALWTREPAPVTPPADSHREELLQLQRWSLQARIASSKVLGWSGNLLWRQQAAEFDVRLSGPLGGGVLSARGSLEQAEVRTARETYVTREPEALLQQQLGWHFPLRRLRYWAMGLAAPDRPSDTRLDAGGRLVELRQDGWTLEYSEYGRYGPYELPRRFSLDNGDTRIRVVVDDWSDLG